MQQSNNHKPTRQFLPHLRCRSGRRLLGKKLKKLRGLNKIAHLDQRLLKQQKELGSYDLWYFYDLLDREENRIVRTIRIKAISTIASVWKNDPETLSWLKTRSTQDEDRVVRQTALQELARGWKDNPETFNIIKTRAKQDENKFVRYTAVHELARGWKEELETLNNQNKSR